MVFALLWCFCAPKEESLKYVSPCHLSSADSRPAQFQICSPAFIDVEGSCWNMSTEPVLHVSLEHCDQFFLHVWLMDVFKPVNMDDDTRGLQIKGLYEGWNEMCYRFWSKPLFLTAAPASLTSDPMQHLQRTSFTHHKLTLHFSTPGWPHDTVATPCMWHQLYYHLTRRTAPVAKSASG